MPRLPPTEREHPRSKGLEALPWRRLLALLHQGDLEAARAVGRALPALRRLCAEAVSALGAGGRIAYLGAGTSGRLGALDAAECPPTFGVSRGQVLALLAGGPRALAHAVEGAEDDRAAGRAAVRRARLGPADLAVGVSASGTTPFVLAGLEEALRRGARAGLITSNPRARPPGVLRVVLATGPELVQGSTRLKAGTATKMALSLFSTATMVRLGRVRDGRMIDLVPTNEKLRLRALRMVGALSQVGPGRALLALEA
ncbi:MAG TPA: N-acetylmuramic acid 6-phosphate etherase, partial [Anaeromyxobacteraceae bacterium]|nr:N-acetylmuramic acid 6-phosphate etherase [Anaeromyxobacteraceae bacterium]